MTMQSAMQRAWSGPTQDDFAAIERLRARHARRQTARAEGNAASNGQPGSQAVSRGALLAAAALAALVGLGAAGFWVAGPRPQQVASAASERIAPAATPSRDVSARRKLAEAMRARDFARESAAKPAMSPDEVAAFRARAASLIEEGRIAGARALLERAARADDAQALFALARTYDPQALSEWKTLGVAPDEARALELYRRAAAAGSSEAARRVDDMAKR